jgi:hypothetical protein
MKRLILAAVAALCLSTAAHADMTDLERSRDPLYGLTQNEFGGCQQLKLALYGLPMDHNGNIYSDSWSPFECYKLQWQAHKDAKTCTGAALSTYQQNAATYDVPANVRKNVEDSCAMLMGEERGKEQPIAKPQQKCEGKIVFNRQFIAVCDKESKQ